MHCSTSSNLSRASPMFLTVFALFTSVCTGLPAAGSSAIVAGAAYALGRDYVVRPHENGTSISQDQSVSTIDIIALNCLKPDGSDLEANATIHLPGQCKIYAVKPGEDCTSIASNNSLTLPEFYAFNPTVGLGNCSNLESGYNVCLTAPQGRPFSPSCPAKSNTTTTTTTTTGTTSQPTPAPGTHPDCLPLQVAKQGDNCHSLAPGDDIPHFLQLNPSLYANCTNLMPGLQYCVSPP